MRLALDPFRVLLISLAGWLNQRQQDVIEYLQEENRLLREQLGGKQLRFSDDQRRRMAVRAKRLGWRMLKELTTRRYLIHDRDPLFTARFLEIVKSAGVQSVRLPPRRQI